MKYGVGEAGYVNSGEPRDARWILGMVERGTNNKRHIFLGQHRTREVIMPVIQQHVAPRSVIYTDNFTSYWTLNDHGYVHAMVNHSIQFVNSYDRSIHTNCVEGNFNHLKKFVNKGCGVQDHLVQRKLNEFDFKSMFLRKKKKRYMIVAKLLGKYGRRALSRMNR